MADADRLSFEIRQDIAAQVGERLPHSAARLALTAPASPELGESLKMVMLPLDRLRDGKGGLAGRVLQTGQWHHQVYSGGRAASFARSVAASDAPGAPHHVVEVAQSTLPEALEASIAWADAHIPEDATAEVLMVPAYQLTALWVHGEGVDAVVIASMPKGLTGLKLNTRIESRAFLRRLAKNDPVPGLGAPTSDRGEEPK